MTALPAIFLDRDGVMNRALVRDGKPYPPQTIDDFEILEGAVTSLSRLADHGYILIGITNQPDVSRGTQTKEIIESFNAILQTRLPVREIFVCYHDDEDQCKCRKPEPGLILQAAVKYDLDLEHSWMVGDRWKDIAAGRAVGLKTIFVDHDYGERYEGPEADYLVKDMAVVADVILQGDGDEKT